MELATFDSPLGCIQLTIDGGAVCRLDFTDSAVPAGTDTIGAVGALEAYFSGAVGALDGVPVRPAGTPFQQRVWAALRTIPTGTTASYAEVAMEVGQPRAVRAVGRANGTNPISLVIPCHRVIRSDGSLGGYGGGLDRKRWLLAHEERALHAVAGGPERVVPTRE